MSKVYQLAIIGAGPAGIATAVEGYLQGIRDIILLEKDQNHRWYHRLAARFRSERNLVRE